MNNLDELLKRAAQHKMTQEEIEAQRQSWARGEAALSKLEHCASCGEEVYPAYVEKCNRCGAPR